jgi:hypothetical protein
MSQIKINNKKSLNCCRGYLCFEFKELVSSLIVEDPTSLLHFKLNIIHVDFYDFMIIYLATHYTFINPFKD